ncbi:MAG: hypothetical protein WDN76_01695 [Alphaproteobacteria bacterium]
MAVAVAFAAAGFLGWQALRDRTAETKAAAPAITVATATPRIAPTIAAEPATPILEDQTAPRRRLAGYRTGRDAAGLAGSARPGRHHFLVARSEAGDRYRPDVGVGWTLHAKDGGAFAVTIDGRPVGVLGEKGSPVLGRHVDTMAETMKPAAPAAAPTQG